MSRDTRMARVWAGCGVRREPACCLPAPSPVRAAVIVLLAVASCGDDAEGVRNAAPIETAGAVMRDHVAATDTGADEPTGAHLVAGIRRSVEVGDISTAQRELDALCAMGPAAVKYLLELFDDFDTYLLSWMRLAEFRDDAVVGVLTRLRTCGDPEVVGRLVSVLGEFENVWRSSADYEAVVGELTRVAGDPRTAPETAESALWTVAHAGGTRGACVCERVFEIWATLRGDDDRHDVATEALSALTSFGSGAAAIAGRAVAVLREDPSLTQEEAQALLRALANVGSAAPETLPGLQSLLASPDPVIRAGAADALRSWGTLAAPASTALTALLDDADPQVRDAAVFALISAGSTSADVSQRLLGIVSDNEPPNSWSANELLRARLHDPQSVAQLFEMAPDLASGELRTLVELLGAERPSALPDLVLHVESRADARDIQDALSELLSALDGSDERAESVADRFRGDSRIVERFRDLLDHADPGVQLLAAEIARSHVAALRERAQSALRELASTGPVEMRLEALGALGEDVQPGAAIDRASVVAALNGADREQRVAALGVLARDDLPVQPVTQETIDWLTRDIFNMNHGYPDRASVLVRCPGGEAALVAAVRGEMQRGRWFFEGDAVIRTLRGAGSRALATRDVLLAARFDEHDERDAEIRQKFEALFAGLSGDARGLALGSNPWDADDVTPQLLSMGRAGCDALVLFAGRVVRARAPRVKPARVDLDFVEAVVAASRAPSGEDDDLSRLGAADLAAWLPAERSVEVLSSLAADSDSSVRRCAVGALGRVESRAPGSVPTAVIATALVDPEVCEAALDATDALGDRARTVADALAAAMRAAADPERVRAAALYVRSGGDPDAAAEAVREVLGRHQRVALPRVEYNGTREMCETDEIPWDDVTTVLTTAAPRAGDVSLIIGVVPPAPVSALCPVLERLGSDAAPAVSMLRDAGSPAAARALAAIGIAARPALPDMRRWAARTGDPDGVIRAAILSLEQAR